jgi:hypothetical protein
MYTVEVRRINVVLMLIVISLGWLTPLLAMQGEGELPVCCQRDGKHKCARRSKAPAGAGMLSQTSRCPMYPAAPATGPGSLSFIAPGDGFAVSLVAAGFRSAEMPVAPGGVVSFLRPLRGPPSPRC